jgi:hypothetical protein
MAFFHEVLIDRRDFDHNIFCAIWHTLATKP